ncbi:unnamed protein product [Amoebophrya sp. A120]|nr:unnamed protein product [Amoebophrya sp. A120]|eukprot:GSA120T00026143001.1
MSALFRSFRAIFPLAPCLLSASDPLFLATATTVRGLAKRASSSTRTLAQQAALLKSGKHFIDRRSFALARREQLQNEAQKNKRTEEELLQEDMEQHDNKSSGPLYDRLSEMSVNLKDALTSNHLISSWSSSKTSKEDEETKISKKQDLILEKLDKLEEGQARQELELRILQSEVTGHEGQLLTSGHHYASNKFAERQMKREQEQSWAGKRMAKKQKKEGRTQRAFGRRKTGGRESREKNDSRGPAAKIADSPAGTRLAGHDAEKDYVQAMSKQQQMQKKENQKTAADTSSPAPAPLQQAESNKLQKTTTFQAAVEEASDESDDDDDDDDDESKDKETAASSQVPKNTAKEDHGTTPVVPKEKKAEDVQPTSLTAPPATPVKSAGSPMNNVALAATKAVVRIATKKKVLNKTATTTAHESSTKTTTSEQGLHHSISKAKTVSVSAGGGRGRESKHQNKKEQNQQHKLSWDEIIAARNKKQRWKHYHHGQHRHVRGRNAEEQAFDLTPESMNAWLEDYRKTNSGTVADVEKEFANLNKPSLAGALAGLGR